MMDRLPAGPPGDAGESYGAPADGQAAPKPNGGFMQMPVAVSPTQQPNFLGVPHLPGYHPLPGATHFLASCLLSQVPCSEHLLSLADCASFVLHASTTE